MALGESLFDLCPKKILRAYEKIMFSGLFKLINSEAKAFRNNESVVYKCHSDFALTVLTDTTERSPTFGLAPFENLNYASEPNSFNHLEILGYSNNEKAWFDLLSRTPRELQWPNLEGKSSMETLLGFSIFENHSRNSPVTTHYFSIKKENSIILELEGNELKIKTDELNYLEECILLKMVLNLYSTCLMGVLGRFESNIMTWVRASNFKLIDRTIRYASLILRQQEIEVSYEALASRLFALEVSESESLVEKLVLEYL
tara:strand:- start:613 stop:1389 length:777 start_codon:yes stop_codon:yes gene_type:complete